eukprot:2891214-Rhodomonas_salina.2
MRANFCSELASASPCTMLDVVACVPVDLSAKEIHAAFTQLAILLALSSCDRHPEPPSDFRTAKFCAQSV